MECHEWQGKQNNFESIAPESEPETPAVEQPGCKCKDEMKFIAEIYGIDGHHYMVDLTDITKIDFNYDDKLIPAHPPALGTYIAIYSTGIEVPTVLDAGCKMCLMKYLKLSNVRPRVIIGTPP